MIPDVSAMVNIKEFGFTGDVFSINKQKLKRQPNGKFSCDQCEYQSVTRNGIKRHKDGVHLGLKYKCSECSIEYSTEKQVKAHVISVHNGEFYNCHICEKKFEQPAVLSQHIKRLHEGVRNYSKCKECDKTFKHGAGLSYHIQKEHRDETHPCDQCNYEAKVLKNLGLHKKRKH
jgi:DNA-directed RNA polymerase subunit RPC12/RpoP